MKSVTMFLMESCPHCRAALGWVNQLCGENPEYKSIEIEKIDENAYPDIAAKFDYYYVPTFYVDGEKLHEGAASLEKIRRVLDAAL